MVPVRLLLPVVALVSFMATPYQALMPIFAAEVFAGGADTLGYLIGAAGRGRRRRYHLARRAQGSARAARLGRRRRASARARRSPYLPIRRDFALSVAMLVIAGAGIVVTVNGISTITMTIVDDGMRGRVMGFYSMAFLGMYPVGSLASGALASWIGATHTLALGGASCMLCALWLWPQLPRLRQHIRPLADSHSLAIT